MEIKDTNTGTLEDKFIHTAVVGDVIKVHYFASGNTNYLWLIYVNNEIRLFDFKSNMATAYVGKTLRELYHDAFLGSNDSDLIDSLEVYKDSVLTVK